MFRKRNEQKFTGHTLLQEYRRRQRFMYAMPKNDPDAESEGVGADDNAISEVEQPTTDDGAASTSDGELEPEA